MKLATWNVNSLRVRFDSVCQWLDAQRPDVVCLQETRSLEKEFPYAALEEVGYYAAHYGVKRYAGVAILARDKPHQITAGFSGVDDDGSPRLLRATVGRVRVVTVYVPTRKAIGKVKWLEQLRDTLLESEDLSRPLILCGDFNICFDERDVYRLEMLSGAAEFPRRVEDKAFRRLVTDCGLVDCFRMHHPEEGEFSWFDYRQGSFRRRKGMRLDYVFANEVLAPACTDAWIDYATRALDKPSDHAPVWAEFDLPDDPSAEQ